MPMTKHCDLKIKNLVNIMSQNSTFLFTYDDQKSIQSVEDRIVAKICRKNYIGGRNYTNPEEVYSRNGTR